MNIAKIESGFIVEVGDVSVIFPNTSFPAGGPSVEWLKENSCLPLYTSLPFNQDTQKLVTVSPYIDATDDAVYTVEVVDLTPEEIAEREAAALKAKREAMVVTPYQAKVVLLQEGSLDEVEAAIATSTDPLVKLAWTNAIHYQRLSPLVTEIATQLGWSDSDLDLLFEAAAQVQ
jgi:HD-GYP domain-containing protein (c-di-GMP phosphodiesterase class II)